MARQVINNNDSGASVRSKLNSMTDELFNYILAGLTWKGVLNNGDSVTGSPSRGDFYYVNEAGTYGGVSCEQYDAIYYNGSSWQKLTNFGGGRLVEIQTYSDGTPSPNPAPDDPLDLNTVTHTLSKTYVTTPKVSIASKCDWAFHRQSVTLAAGTVTVVVGVGAYGSVADTSQLDYELQVFSNNI